ncbi:MAG: beta family protein [Thermodesulfovibrionales bacterium]|nr:beta family protein [Thermodesulfovibrionales bacterium]
MFNHLHYVPILQSKRAEFSALHQLSNDAKVRLTPLINIIPVPWNHAKNEPTKTLKAHLDRIIAYIEKLWGGDYSLFLDLMYVASNNEVIEGKHSAIYCLETLRHYSHKIIPVTGLDRDDNYQNAIKSIVKRHKSGICFRIQQTELDDLDELADTLNGLLRKFNIEAKFCDVILDFQALPLQDVRDPVTYIAGIIKAFPYVTKWRTFTIAGSNFPKILEMNADSDTLIPRAEYLLWRQIVTSGKIQRLPSFGDYSIQHPEISDLDFRKIKSSVNLRYATENHWRVYKAREKFRYGYDQFNDICNDLITTQEYYGSHFSEGDKYIDRCAKNTNGPGTPEIWRKVGFNHHMTLIAKQLSNFGAS